MIDISEFDLPEISGKPLLSLKFEEERVKRQKFSKQETIALEMYTYHFDNAINSNLRKGRTSYFISGIIDNILSALNKVEQVGPFLAFRGIKKPWTNFHVGMKFRDPAFQSKSWHPICALEFTGKVCCMFVLDYHVPTKQIFLEGITQKKDEHEVLSYPGEEWEIIAEGTYSWDNNPPIKAYYCKYLGYHIEEIIPEKEIDEIYTGINQLLHEEDVQPEKSLRYGVLVYTSQEKEEVYFTKNEEINAALMIANRKVIFSNRNFDFDFDERIEYIYYLLEYSDHFFLNYYDMMLSKKNFSLCYEETVDGITSEKITSNKQDFRDLIIKILDSQVNFISKDNQEIFIEMTQF